MAARTSTSASGSRARGHRARPRGRPAASAITPERARPGPPRELAERLDSLSDALRAARQGDFAVRIPTENAGAFAEVALAFNALVAQNEALVGELERVARRVTTDGDFSERVSLSSSTGGWRTAVGAVNELLASVEGQRAQATRILEAVAAGDLSHEMPLQLDGEPLRGQFLHVSDTINRMVARLRTVSAGVSRVVREIGVEGRLGVRASVDDTAGTWRELLEDVNLLSGNLTAQVRNIALVSTAIANGDLSQKITVDTRGEILELKNTINTSVDQLRTFASEVTRVAKEVGTDGKLGGQAHVPGVAGTWKELTDNVNVMASNLTSQVRGIAAVVTAVADGDLTQKLVVEAAGEIAALAETINNMTYSLRTFADQVTTVAREVGIEGRLGGQARVPGVAGTWRDLTESVNVMASNLTSQVRGIARVVTAVANGELGQKLVLEARGEIAALADTINDMTSTLRTFADQVTTVARDVGMEGKLGGQARVPGAAGTWRGLTDSVNMLAGNLTSQVRNIALVTTAVANGDLSRKITVEAKGEILELKDTVNGMVDQLRTFAAEVTRVARDVGTEGKLGGQAAVPGVGGTWKNLTESVNLMASNLTSQVRGIVRVVTSVANGDLSRKLVVDAKGEIAALADTLNGMTDTLRTFAEQVTTVAREVGIEGKLGGQAKVPGAAGTWRDLVDNVNQLAGNLTTQVRAISDVATAVTKGDLTRTIDVSAAGEVLALKDTINQMIANLRDTTRTNREQDWLKTNLARFSALIQGQRDLESLGRLIMSELTPAVSGQLGTFYVLGTEGDRPVLKLLASYAFTRRKSIASTFALGEGLVGQAALEKKLILVTQIPEDYAVIASSIGEAPPRNIVVLPILFEGAVRGVIELGAFEPFRPIQLTFLEQLAMSIGVVFNMIGASRRTEELLEELKGSNAELARRSTELEDKARLLEDRNHEIAEASASLEEKAKQLALVSKYKTEFLANMSHELRTPLNSVIILSGLLVEDHDRNLTPDQLEYARTILSSGRDLLGLINQILDLSKIEAGRLEVERKRVLLGEVAAYAEQHFRPIALQKHLAFRTSISPEAPTTLLTDPQRLQQVLKNLLSNAFKFTETGSVDLRVDIEHDTRKFQSAALRRAAAAIAFSISDTGIGIPPGKQQIIFDAFQQGDPSTSRVYGGTGLGLTISRELARLLGGEIHLRSVPGAGSTFLLYLPAITEEETAAQEAPYEAPQPGPSEVARAVEVVPGTPMPPTAPVPAERPPEAGPDLEDVKVLVVDDDVRNLFAITSLLERRGATVLPAAGAKEAFEVLEANDDTAIVLMDMMMPEVDGFEATRRLRADPRYRTVPVIALTAKAMPGDREKALEAGCNDFVAKPVEQEQLVDVIRRWTAREGGA